MVEPLSLGFLASQCAFGAAKGLSGAGAVAVAKRALGAFGQRTAEGEEVLRATHRAFVHSIQRMAEACSISGGEAADQFSAAALSKLAGDSDFTEFHPGDGSIPAQELDERIRAIFQSPDRDPALAAADSVVAEIEARMGSELTRTHRDLFRTGSEKHLSWSRVFELLFAEAVMDGERLFRAVAFERLNEIVSFAQEHASEINALRISTREDFSASAERDARMESKLDSLLEAVLAQRGGQIEAAHIDSRAVVRIARKVSENVRDADQALAEIDAAIDDLLALRRDAAQGSNLDALVETALRNVDRRAAAGEFDAAAEEAAQAFAAWEAREADRLERERAVGMRIADENVRTNRLRRDPGTVAEWLQRRIRLQATSGDDLLQMALDELRVLIESGRNGVNFDLEIATHLAELTRDSAGGEERKSALFLLGNALQILGEREEGPERLIEAAAAYGEALEATSRESDRFQWARIKNNEAIVLLRLGERQQGTEVLEQAVAAYGEALEAFDRDRLPLDWAAAQNNLAAARSAIGERRESTEEFEQAVIAYRTALEVYTLEKTPSDWAMVHNNLGSALARLADYQVGEEALTAAADSFNQALKVYTRKDKRLNWALVQNNLGNTLTTLGKRQARRETLDEAIAAYHASLEVRTREQFPFLWARTMENLGYALDAKAFILNDCALAGQSVEALEAALEVFAHPQLAWNRDKAERGLASARKQRDRLCGGGDGTPSG